LLARTVAAALGADLVLDMHRRGAGLDERARGARHVEGARAEPGVDVDEQRQVADLGDAPDVSQHVVEIGDAEVGHAERAGGDAGPGKIGGAVADALRHHGVIGADRADDLQGSFLGQRPPEPRSGVHSRCLTLSRSSWSSFRVASILLRLNSEISMPLTIEYLPPCVVTG